MTERPGGSPPDPAPPAQFPGATRVTVLEVYDWPTPDGLKGGSAHMHLASAEGYYVLSGSGALQTLGGGGYREAPLRPGDCLWFTPGVIHRLVNSGDLRILVVMQNAGLPEHGDAVLTFPPAVLADPAAYAAAAALPADPSLAEAAARRRRDLAIEGYLELRDRVSADGPSALEDFYREAVALTGGRVPDWRGRWQAGAQAAAQRTGRELDALAAGVAGHLAEGGLWRIARPEGRPAFGMCGRLTGYDPAAAGDPPRR
jgi:mannose-6-phosphate isomerase-like protein (cupin superfamily)